MSEEELGSRETAAREMERKKKIEAYLRESFAGEERVPEPMDPKCEVSVVIPAYAERDAIMRPLVSLARQEGVRPESYEVIFVLNNPPSEPEREEGQTAAEYRRKRELYAVSVRENQQTLGLLSYLKGGPVPPDATGEEMRLLEEVKASGLRVRVVDKASAGKTFPADRANVGASRNRGVAEAVERFFRQGRNGIVAQSDADTRFAPDYIRRLVGAFEDPALVGLVGECEFERSDEVEALFAAPSSQMELLTQYHQLVEQLKNGKKEGQPAAPNIPFNGANMASRAFEAALVGGISATAGGEDTQFGIQLGEIGKIARVPEVVNYPLDRFSARTSESAGHGQKRLKLADTLQGGGLVENPDVAMRFPEIRDAFLRSFRKGKISVPELRSIFSVQGTNLLSDAQLGEAAKELEKNKKLVSLSHLPVMKRLRAALNESLRSIFPDVPLERAVETILRHADADPALAGRSESILEELRLEESEKIRRKENMVRGIAGLLLSEGISEPTAETVVRLALENKDALGLDDEAVKKIPRAPEMSLIAKALAGISNGEEGLLRVKRALPRFFEKPEEDPVLWDALKLRALSYANE